MIRRGVCAFLGLFLLVNRIGEVLSPGFDCTIWLFDLRPLSIVGKSLATLAGLALVVQAVRPAKQSHMRWVVGAFLIGLGLIAAMNSLAYFRLLAGSRIQTGFPVPMSLLVLLVLIDLIVRTPRWRELPCRRPWLRFGVGFAACGVLLPLAQMCFFGQTDYRRPAGAAVVFGARAYADGSCSQALADRVRTACDLYQTGQVDRLIFSGGPGDGAIDEPHAMRTLAMRLGVPESAIELDPAGLSTEATVRNTESFLGHAGRRTKLLAVSHGYHLPRVKAAYRRAGVEVYTVPARETRTLARKPLLIAREVVATWAYFFRTHG